jgi:hypothetical protein
MMPPMLLAQGRPKPAAEAAATAAAANAPANRLDPSGYREAAAHLAALAALQPAHAGSGATRGSNAASAGPCTHITVPVNGSNRGEQGDAVNSSALEMLLVAWATLPLSCSWRCSCC